MVSYGFHSVCDGIEVNVVLLAAVATTFYHRMVEVYRRSCQVADTSALKGLMLLLLSLLLLLLIIIYYYLLLFIII